MNHVFRELHADLYTSDASNILILTKVNMNGNHLEDFMNRWSTVIHELPMEIDEKSLMDIFLEQLRFAPVLKDEI